MLAARKLLGCDLAKSSQPRPRWKDPREEVPQISPQVVKLKVIRQEGVLWSSVAWPLDLGGILESVKGALGEPGLANAPLWYFDGRGGVCELSAEGFAAFQKLHSRPRTVHLYLGPGQGRAETSSSPSCEGFDRIIVTVENLPFGVHVLGVRGPWSEQPMPCVFEVARFSPAEVAGVHVGDLVTQAAGEPVTSDDFFSVVERAPLPFALSLSRERSSEVGSIRSLIAAQRDAMALVDVGLAESCPEHNEELPITCDSRQGEASERLGSETAAEEPGTLEERADAQGERTKELSTEPGIVKKGIVDTRSVEWLCRMMCCSALRTTSLESDSSVLSSNKSLLAGSIAPAASDAPALKAGSALVSVLRERSTSSADGDLRMAIEASASEARARLDRVLGQRGATLRPIRADGNCQFRALAAQLYGDEGRHRELRSRVVEHLRLGREWYQAFTDEPFDEYVARIARDREWGDNMTLQAACDALGRDICVLTDQPGNEYFELRPTFLPPEEQDKPLRPLCLTFLTELHYDVFEVESDPHLDIL